MDVVFFVVRFRRMDVAFSSYARVGGATVAAAGAATVAATVAAHAQTRLHRHACASMPVQACLHKRTSTGTPFFVARFRRMDGGGVLLRRFSSYAHVAVAVAVAAATTAATAAVAASEYVAGRARCNSHGNNNQLVLLQLLQLLVRLLLFALLPTAAAVAKQQ